MDWRGTADRVRDIGITQRATPLELPWTGELRVRFTDFQVNEIGEDGKVLRLKSIGMSSGDNDKQTSESQSKSEAPQEEKPKVEEQESKQDPEAPKEAEAPMEEPQQEPQEESTEVSPEDIAILTDLAGAAFAEAVVDMMKTSADPESVKKRATAEATDDRQKRGKIHHEVRRIFDSKIETSTDDSGAIVASLAVRRGKKRSRGGRNHNKGSRNGAPEETPAGEYLHFTLYKDNRDTLDAVNQVARALRVKPQVVAYAGTKDRRASTVQRCSVRYTKTRQLAAANSRLRGVVTGDYEYKQEPLHLGQLQGNEFVITIKNCHAYEGMEAKPLEERMGAIKTNAQTALDHMAKHGWINFFGHQRFGTHSIGTHQVGQLILGEKYEDAVNSLLSYDPEIAEKGEKGDLPEEASQREEIFRHQACMLFLTDKDHNRAINIMPRRFTAETCILRHLTRSGKQSRLDYAGAIVHITRGLRTMYIHAYQSYVWNHAASHRWERYGSTVVEGDLVFVDKDSKAEDVEPEKDQDGDDIINPNDVDDTDPAMNARPLTAEEAASGRFTINDVVLPVPGYEVIYPNNDIGTFYKDFMARPENGALDPNSMRRVRREFSLPGRYRRFMNHFLATPSIEFKTYTDDTEQMHPTDLDLIRSAKKRGRNAEDGEPDSKKVKSEGGEGDATAQGQDNATQEKVVEAPQKIAAVVKFQLGSSAYATVTLRELTGDPPESSTST